MKKVGIITFHASHNYGSNLQAYALQKKISELGYECEIINFRTKKQKELYKVLTSRIGIKYMLKNIYTIIFIYRKRKSKFKKFELFINQNLKLTKEISNIEEFREISKEFDYIIAGSDQIWNVKADDFNLVYMLPCITPKKISYAVSTGEQLEKEAIVKEEIDLINNIDYLSVRDEYTKNIVSELSGRRDVEVVLDPTMLYDSNFYLKLICDKPIIKEKYIYLYTLGNSKNLLDIAKELSKKTKLPIYISHVSGTNYMFNGLKKQLDSGPLEFINHIMHAEYILTSSFHATIFSILFNKQFWSYNAIEDNRRKEILSKLNLLDRSINKQDCNEKFKDVITTEQYSAVNNILEKEKLNSIEFIKKALECKSI